MAVAVSARTTAAAGKISINDNSMVFTRPLFNWRFFTARPWRIFDLLRGLPNISYISSPLAGKTLGLEGQPKGADKEEG